jgi:hypothetical protein
MLDGRVTGSHAAIYMAGVFTDRRAYVSILGLEGGVASRRRLYLPSKIWLGDQTRFLTIVSRNSILAVRRIHSVLSQSMSATPDRILGTPATRSRTTAIACRRCHARKVKCSGGQPCSNCRRDVGEAECSYPNRVKHVKVKQRYARPILGAFCSVQLMWRKLYR